MSLIKKQRFVKGLAAFAFLTAVMFVSVNFGWGANPKVVAVASTSWTGAIAEAAGADEVRVLAPFELKHPPEYDYRPADIAKIGDATLLVYAGYEGFIKKLIEASDIPEAKVAKVTTANDPANLKQQARLLAEKLGTVDKENEWEIQFNKVTDAILKRAELKKAGKTRVLFNSIKSRLQNGLAMILSGYLVPGN